jgi:hypothetical protein
MTTRERFGVAVLVLAAFALGLWVMHKWMTCEPCRRRRAALMRRWGSWLIEPR